MIILVAICAVCLIALAFPGLLSALIGIPVLLALIWYGGIFGWILGACVVFTIIWMSRLSDEQLDELSKT